MAREGHFRGMGTMAGDPVCGMVLDKQSADARSEHGRKTYYFCSLECQSLFDGNPTKYAEGGGHDTVGRSGQQM